MDEIDEAVEELTLLLLSLTSWTEDSYGFTVQRAWKGFRFEVLDSLEEKNYISQTRRAKSVYLTEEGLRKAEGLKRKYLKVE